MLAEGLFLPFCFYLTHENFRDAIKVSLKRPNRDKYSSSPGSIKKPPFFLNYNDFVMIDKPYLGLFRKDSKINTSTLNLVSNFRRNQEMLQKNKKKNQNNWLSEVNSEIDVKFKLHICYKKLNLKCFITFLYSLIIFVEF